ncbi:hypothetical protein NLJ89_g3988 [Agrocybe chaxingu]|uniref:N-acetyltransferase domain-containing protein n=1 Tax=Agrocybe chaxingu TaxID=84603 RepID=A0A9W8K2Y6_9AGAR|nr:hypothetical protein NLJ89_g3988 [Agrocybe chaxingu]
MTLSMRDATEDDIPQPLYSQLSRLPAVRPNLQKKLSSTGHRVLLRTGFRTPAYYGYLHTAEITIYVTPVARTKGTGTKRVDALIGALKNTAIGTEGPKIKQAMSVITLNEEEPGGGYGLRDWYGRWGPVQVRHVKKVGFKFGKWVHVLILQVSINEGGWGGKRRQKNLIILDSSLSQFSFA